MTDFLIAEIDFSRRELQSDILVTEIDNPC